MAKLKKRRSILVKFRNYFFAGIVVLIPLGITLYFTLFLINISSEHIKRKKSNLLQLIVVIKLSLSVLQKIIGFCNV